MKMIVIVALALVAAAATAPTEEPAQILKSQFETKPEGGYEFGYETSDGSKKQETGEIKEALDEDNKPHKVITARGYFSYPSPDGQIIEISYYADETGFHPEGASIPKVARR